ncbi:DEAD/DEAH box helicase family protein [Mediterraneibacter glycyrrhizinilyticus]|uniref:DEAD/DEAH box helicase family protein n=1 Tax=Mediterraneibacter glycyrrhizinilyticus TaxID=342942 RepID=UPI0006D29062
MSFKDLDINLSYISCGEKNIADSFLVPVLKHSKRYRRSVGFFSSGVFGPIIDGIVTLSRNGGKIELIASPQLEKEDIEAINLGYQKREEIIENAFSRDFMREIEVFDDAKLQLLVSLIANGTLDIKIAVTESAGIYHDKLGILEDFEGNMVVFYGSANSSLNGYQNNYEKIRVVKSWNPSDSESILDECKEFENLWSGKNEFVKIYNYKESAASNILKVIQKRQGNNSGKTDKSDIKLRDYQEAAINAWVQNEYHGFFVMATGTGKTWTAIYAAKKLVMCHSSMIVICAPYKHLVKQWSEDVEKAFPNAKIVLVSSENPNWENQILEEIIRKKYRPENQIIIISTIASFKMERFEKVISKSKDEKLLIVDEAHRFSDRPDYLKETYNYLLGLSATPYSGNSAQKGRDLMEWFGGQVFDLPIEVALEKGYLVPYNYFPIYVYATDDEENKFRYYTQRILSCFKNGRCINPDLLVKSLRNRLRIISMASEKQGRIHEILGNIKEKDHFVVYCGDGKLFDLEAGEEIRHIQSIKRILSYHGYKASQFTATENMKDRMELVDAFNKQEISALAAIRCLDEGINIPSIKSALILSSNDDYREFVQRRGRILRKYVDKEYANIYDVVVLPSHDMRGWAKIELRRFREYARLASNWCDLEKELDTQLLSYGLSDEDVDVYDYDDMEEFIDE